jgi:hypothetical protein
MAVLNLSSDPSEVDLASQSVVKGPSKSLRSEYLRQIRYNGNPETTLDLLRRPLDPTPVHPNACPETDQLALFPSSNPQHAAPTHPPSHLDDTHLLVMPLLYK